jgi:predicted nuclease of restriction endonuclease-like (RecB) superfamily
MEDRRIMSKKAEHMEIEKEHPVGPIGSTPRGYTSFIRELKDRIRTARTKAFLSVNRELIELYWHIGRSIVEKQQRWGWGKSVVNRLANDIQSFFPGIVGFSPQNIWYMRSFYLAWTEDLIKLQQPVGELDGKNLPRTIGEIPWGHNLQLLSKLKDPVERLWYAHKTIEHGWSRAILVHQIEYGTYDRQGGAITNFKHSLPSPQSDLAQQSIKDPYVFDFLTLSDDAVERDIERGLIDQIRKFLLELGVGFAFVGSQYHLEIDGEDFYIDLLFYHIRLRCFVIIDLKTGDFKPEYAGKMNFYLAALDDRLRHRTDNPSIGIILCKTKKKVIAEYALRNTSAPIGVSEYRSTRKIPAELRANLPSIEDIEKKLARRKRRQDI